MNRRQKLVQQQFLSNETGIIKRLNQVYGQALKDVNANIERLMKRFDPETGDLPQSAIYQLKYQKMVKDQLEGILNELQTKQFVSVAEYLDTCYEDGFVGGLFDLHGQDVPLMMPLDQEAMVTAVQLDSKISKGLYTRLGEDVSTLKKRITAEVSRSIATGVAFADTAKQLAGKTRIGYNNAIRIARTEGHRIQNQATMNVMEQAKERGADVVKQWDATLDGKTRESHVAVDGEIRELDERFSNGLRFPGDPAGSAAEVINCRCATLQRARWAVGGSFTKWNNFTKQLETFDSPEAYDEFKKAFFSDGNKRYMNYVQQMEKKYGTRDWATVLDRMDTREYNHYSKLLKTNPVFNKGTKIVDVVEDVIIPVRPVFVPAKTLAEAEAYAKKFADDVSYKGISLANCNAINEQLDVLMGKYPCTKYVEIRQKKMRAIATANYQTLKIDGQRIGKTDGGEVFSEMLRDSEIALRRLQARFAGKKPPPDVQRQMSKLESGLKFTRWSVGSDHGVKGIISHEFGHTLADQYIGLINGADATPNASTLACQTARKLVADTMVRAWDTGDIYAISKYGSNDENEFFAEVFAMREMGETLPDYMEEMLKAVLGK